MPLLLIPLLALLLLLLLALVLVLLLFLESVYLLVRCCNCLQLENCAHYHLPVDTAV